MATLNYTVEVGSSDGFNSGEVEATMYKLRTGIPMYPAAIGGQEKATYYWTKRCDGAPNGMYE